MLGNKTVMTHISKTAQFETGEPDPGSTVKCFKLYYCKKYADITLEPERDNPNDIRTKLAQHVQVAHKMAALSSDWSDPDMSVDPEVGSMIPEDLSTKCSIGSMIQSDPTIKFDSRSWIPLDPSVI